MRVKKRIFVVSKRLPNSLYAPRALDVSSRLFMATSDTQLILVYKGYIKYIMHITKVVGRMNI